MVKTPFLQFREAISSRTFKLTAFASVILFLILWSQMNRALDIPKIYLPSPVDICKTGLRMFLYQGFGSDVLASTLRILVAFAASAVLAIPLGLLMSCFKILEAVFQPIIDFIRYIPVPALLPMFVIWAGIGEGSKFLVLFFGTFFQLVLLVLDDADNVPNILFDQAKTLGATNAQLFWHLLLPCLGPQLFDRMRVTLGWCWTYLVIAELIAVQNGIGHVIKEAQRTLATSQIYWSCLVLGFIGLGTDLLAKYWYAKCFPYTQKTALGQMEAES